MFKKVIVIAGEISTFLIGGWLFTSTISALEKINNSDKL